jgi:hypothetical protein
MDKEILDIVKSDEIVEPETIRHIFKNISDKDVDKILAFIALYRTRFFWENFYVFEDIVLALNEITPNFSILQGCMPEQIWYALSVANQLYPTREYAPEILKYIEYMFAKYGVYIYPPYLNGVNNQYYEKAITLVKNGPFPLGDDSPEEIQAAKYLDIMLYLNNKK